MMTPDLARHMARIALGHVTLEYPHGMAGVLDGPADVGPHRARHPVFFGSFDWHSCVHGWWLLLRLARLCPEMPEAAGIAALARTSFTPEKLAAEQAWFARPSARGFERPYGWAWLLALHHEARHHGLGPALAPLAATIAAGFHAHLPLLGWPIRSGAHGNTGFALALAAPWARTNDPALLALMQARAAHWFPAATAAAAAPLEPDGDAFLSPSLTAALAIARLDAAGFPGWFDAAFPAAATGQPETLFTPATPSDRSDGKIAHLDGLNLSRAWCWRVIAAALPSAHPARPALAAAAHRHIAASLPHIAGDYAGSHWLASFALLALSGDDDAPDPG